MEGPADWTSRREGGGAHRQVCPRLSSPSQSFYYVKLQILQIKVVEHDAAPSSLRSDQIQLIISNMMKMFTVKN